MQLWIRSHDRKLLSDGVTNIRISRSSNTVYKYSITRFKDFASSITLGCYTTKEKAMKVLDMIEEHIIEKEKFVYGKFVKQEIKPFIMPQDDEVE